MRIAYAGSPAAAVAPLRALNASDHEVALVITQPDRPRGRRGSPVPTPVAEAARELGLPVLRPATINAPEVVAALEEARVDALVVVAFGQILREGILSRWPCVNVHFSLLPAYRGAAPVERALMDGVDATGVTIMLMDAGLDTGPMLTTARIRVTDDDTGGEVTERLSDLGARLLVDALAGLETGALTAESQPEEGVSLAPKIGPDDRVVRRDRPARAVVRHIQALAPHIGATAVIDGQPFKLWAARAGGQEGRETLSAVDGRLLLRCADGAVEILELQPPGKGRMRAPDFLRGWRGGLDWEEPGA
ncbi:MAG: methionyl-tRNA formyltransferase [Thermoleophilia bacterium]